MKKLLLFFAFYAVFQNADIWATDIFTVPVIFSTGSSLTQNSGVQFNFNGPVDWTGATITNFPTPTVTIGGNASGSAVPPATLTLTINTIPDGTSEPGSLLFTNIAAPVAPSAGLIKGYANSTDKRFHDVNDAGTTGTTVVANAGASNNFLTAVSTAGVFSLAQPLFSNLSGNIAITQEPSIAANNLIGNATGGAAVPTAVSPATARSSSLLNIDQKTTVGDAAYTILSTDRTVVGTTAFTTSRTWTLAAANSVNAGQTVMIADEGGAVNGLNTLSVTRASSDTIEPGANTTVILKSAKQSITLTSDGVSKWYISSFNAGTSTVSGQVVMSNGSGVMSLSAFAYPATASTTDYSLIFTGGNAAFYPSILSSSSTSTVSAGYAADTYLAGSAPPAVNAGDFKVQGQYHCRWDMTKTAAGTIAPIITLRAGTTATTADTAVLTFTLGAGTAVADTAWFELFANVRTAGSSAIVQATLNVWHTAISGSGITSTADKSLIPFALTTSAAVNLSTATRIGVSFNGGTSFSGTNTQVIAELKQP